VRGSWWRLIWSLSISNPKHIWRSEASVRAMETEIAQISKKKEEVEARQANQAEEMLIQRRDY